MKLGIIIGMTLALYGLLVQSNDTLNLKCFDNQEGDHERNALGDVYTCSELCTDQTLQLCEDKIYKCKWQSKSKYYVRGNSCSLGRYERKTINNTTLLKISFRRYN